MSAPSQPVESLLARLEGVKNQGGFYRAFCPAHDDRITPNLDIKEGGDGRVLLLCRAGCSTEAVVETLGLKMRDLFSSGDQGGGERDTVSDLPLTSPSCTLEAYAEAKRLPVEFLKSLGLSNLTYSGSPAIRIPYKNREDQEKAVRFRFALEKGEEEADLEPWHALQRWFESPSATRSVTVPYAKALADMIPPLAVRLRRDFGALLSLPAQARPHQAPRARAQEARRGRPPRPGHQVEPRARLPLPPRSDYRRMA